MENESPTTTMGNFTCAEDYTSGPVHPYWSFNTVDSESDFLSKSFTTDESYKMIVFQDERIKELEENCLKYSELINKLKCCGNCRFDAKFHDCNGEVCNEWELNK